MSIASVILGFLAIGAAARPKAEPDLRDKEIAELKEKLAAAEGLSQWRSERILELSQECAERQARLVACQQDLVRAQMEIDGLRSYYLGMQHLQQAPAHSLGLSALGMGQEMQNQLLQQHMLNSMQSELGRHLSGQVERICNCAPGRHEVLRREIAARNEELQQQLQRRSRDWGREEVVLSRIAARSRSDG
jgi:hypothetical protein